MLSTLSACDGIGGDEDLVLGVTGPFSKPWGQEMLLGARLAADAINAAGGVEGRKLVLREIDDADGTGRAIEAAQQLLEDPEVAAVVGPMTSGSVNDAYGVYDQGLPAIATSATSPDISGISEWMFRMIPDDRAIAVAAAEFAGRELGARRVAVLYANDSYGRGLVTAFRTAFVGTGGEIVEEDPYLESMEDFTPYLQRVLRTGPDVLFVAGVPGSAARILAQSRGLGLDLPVVGGDALAALSAGDVPLRRVYSVVAYHPEGPTEENREFVRLFRDAHGRDPSPESAPAYDAVRLLARLAASGATDRREIRAALAGLAADHPFTSVSGPLTFDESRDVKGLSLQVVRVRPGGLDLTTRGAN